jgi:hypothetical protein
MKSRVKNADLDAVSRVIYLMQDIRMLEERRDWTRERLHRLTKGLSGMPRGGGGPQGMDDTFAKLSELDDKHREKLRRCTLELTLAEGRINAIPDPRMRTFVTMVYLMHTGKDQVMRELNLTEWGYRQAKEAVENAASMEKVPGMNL